MMGQICSRPLISTVLAMTVGLGTGCSHWIELAVPSDAAPPTSATVATDARVPLLLGTLHVTQNGAPVAPPAVTTEPLSNWYRPFVKTTCVSAMK